MFFTLRNQPSVPCSLRIKIFLFCGAFLVPALFVYYMYNGYTYKTHERDTYKTQERDTYKTHEGDTYKTHESGTYKTHEGDTYKTHESDTYKTLESDTYKTRESGTYKTHESDTYKTRESETEVRHVAFLKVHKTGSTTVQNVFLRFGDSRNLTFILGNVENNECISRGKSWPNCISFYNTLTENNTVPPPKGRVFEILCSHVIYDKQQFSKFLPRDTRLISLVREPVSRLVSAIEWFGLLKGVNTSAYARDPTLYDNFRLNNAMADEFGFPKELFPSKTRKFLNETDVKKVYAYTRQLIQDFELILINEKLDQSLVLLRRVLRWKTQDILYLSKRVKRRSRRPVFSKEDSKKLRSYLSIDYALYETALQELETKIANSGPYFDEEVKEFKTIRARVKAFCGRKPSAAVLVVKGTQRHDEFTVTQQYCERLLMAESTYLTKIRLKQYGTRHTD